MNPFRTLTDYFTLRRRFRRWTAEDIRRHQWREVDKLVRLARSRSPFYRDLYAGRDVQSLRDFASLPTIDKQTMMEHFDTLNTAGLELKAVTEYAVRKELDRDFLGYYRDEYVVGLSSGTSGARGKMTLWMQKGRSRSAVSARRVATREPRRRSRCGIGSRGSSSVAPARSAGQRIAS